jgi:hypothetical protein
MREYELVDNPSFEYNDRFAMGDREAGTVFDVHQFNAKAFRKNPTDTRTAFPVIGHWSVRDNVEIETGVQLCDDQFQDDGKTIVLPCEYRAVYRTADNSRIVDMPPIQAVDNDSSSYNTLFFVIGGFDLLLVVAFAAHVALNESNPIWKSAQPGMLYLSLLGQMLIGIRVILGALPTSDSICASNVMLGHVGTLLVFGSSLVKTWRLEKVLSVNTIKRVKITQSQILLAFGAAVAAVTVGLIGWVAGSDMHMLVVEADQQPQLNQSKLDILSFYSSN